MKAYTVREDFDGRAVVVFANESVVARRIGANQLDLGFEIVDSCRRSPEFDQYAPGPVPTKALIEAGWWFEATDGGRVDQDDEGLFFPKGTDHVYRSWMGWLDERVSEAKRRATEAYIIAACKAKFPFATDLRAYISSSYIGLDWHCTFSWPGMKHGTATWEYATERILVCQGDLEAWEAFRDRGYQP